MRDCGCQAEIRINDLDILITPAETEGTLPESILQVEALLIGEYLMGRRLANVDDRFAGEMLRCD
jgi:hypothetical protein